VFTSVLFHVHSKPLALPSTWERKLKTPARKGFRAQYSIFNVGSASLITAIATVASMSVPEHLLPPCLIQLPPRPAFIVIPPYQIHQHRHGMPSAFAPVRSRFPLAELNDLPQPALTQTIGSGAAPPNRVRSSTAIVFIEVVKKSWVRTLRINTGLKPARSCTARTPASCVPHDRSLGENATARL
jgi:hypothetical protein